MGRAVKDIGLDGVELTVRPGGHVDPERVRDDLPRAVHELHTLGLEVPAITTDIRGSDTPHTRDVCTAAAEVGVPILRNAAWRYRPFGTIEQQIDAARHSAHELEALAREFDLRICVHAHLGRHLTAQGALLARIIDDTDPRYVGVSFDLGQMTVEGGAGGWVLSLDLLKQRIGMLSVTSYGWVSSPDAETGGTQWTPLLIPLEQGAAQWARAFGLLRQNGWDADDRAVVSLLSEYRGDGSWKDLTVPELLAQTAADLAFLRRQAVLAC